MSTKRKEVYLKRKSSCNPEVELIKKIASISIRAERNRITDASYQAKLYRI